MDFPQSTLEEIADSELQMVLAAEKRFGQHYVNARAASVFLSRCVIGIDHDRMIFARYFALMKKYHMLALLSVVRRHKVQAMMDLRQVLEAGAAAAFAIANPENEHFFEVDEDNIITSDPKLTVRRYRWLEQNCKAVSDNIKAKKGLINNQQAHANVVSTDSVFGIAQDGEMVDAPFFDAEDPHFVKIDLWLSASVALDVMDLFYGVNQGRDVITFMDHFPEFFTRLQSDTEALRQEIMATDRAQAALVKGIRTKL
ncbi:hypothetical protein SE92_03725 [Bradyrhizobium sp. AT1]|uniref:hypothetical protein n=1 Tax=Bradyrhizobium sp. AT1 TaxID=574934 RepID=UPI0007914840|nr:hypothetical protein [Bradyrhizobium sp. AT1]KYG19477.1 hypothetical protein SE92_03725 [Bradyrhizobium sp. AT1]